jgi:hypothetical protein
MMTISVSPWNDLFGVIYATLCDGLPHVDDFTDQPGWTWRDWCNDKKIMVNLIRVPLLQWVASRSSDEKEKIKHALQYLLNVDEHVPYVLGSFRVFPELQEKTGSVTSRIFASYQDTNCPLDSYALCEWIWEILYGNEDWHTDISTWVVSD